MKRMLGCVACLMVLLISAAFADDRADLEREADALLEEVLSERYGQAVARLMVMRLDEQSARWECTSRTAVFCFKGRCNAQAAQMTMRLDFPRRLYQRCDSAGCGEHSMEWTRGGIYTEISRPGVLFKVMNNGADFADVAVLATGVFINTGRCVPTVDWPASTAKP